MKLGGVFSSSRVAVSFNEDNGIYWSPKGVSKTFHEGEVLHIFSEEGITIDSVKGSIEEVSPELEARALFSLFEDIVVGHHEFLSDYEFTNRLPYKGVGLRTYRPSECLKRLSSDFIIDNKQSSFAILYKELEDELIEISLLSLDERMPSSLRKRLDNKISILAKILESYYGKAECIIGLNDYFSIRNKPYEMAFGFTSPALPTLSHVFEHQKQFVTINPFMHYWLLEDIFSRSDGYLKPRYLKLGFIDVSKIPSVTLESIRLITYVPSSKLFPYTVSDERVKELIINQITKVKPYILPQDMLFSSSIPSRVSKINFKREDVLSLQEPTPLGIIEVPYPHPTLIEKSTHIEIEFFNYPLFNSNVPVVFDTSALDISRFPYTSPSTFITRFLKNREVLLPKVVLYELKRRMRKDVEKKKVQKALFRLNQFRGMGIINNIKVTGSFDFATFSLTKDKKDDKRSLIEDVEDYRDISVLISAIKNKAVLFTNDENLRDMAIACGVYTIWYNGIEDDILACIRTQHFKLSTRKLIDVVKVYSAEVRGEPYKENDIREVIEMLKQRGIIRERKGKLGIYSG